MSGTAQNAKTMVHSLNPRNTQGQIPPPFYREDAQARTAFSPGAPHFQEKDRHVCDGPENHAPKGKNLAGLEREGLGEHRWHFHLPVGPQRGMGADRYGAAAGDRCKASCGNDVEAMPSEHKSESCSVVGGEGPA